MRSRPFSTWAPLAIAFAGTAIVTSIGRAMDLNPVTVGFGFLVVVLVSSLRGGLPAGMVASVIATLSYNFFFFPPLHVHDPRLGQLGRARRVPRDLGHSQPARDRRAEGG